MVAKVELKLRIRAPLVPGYGVRQQTPMSVPAATNTNDQHDELISTDFMKNKTTAAAKPAQTQQFALRFF